MSKRLATPTSPLTKRVRVSEAVSQTTRQQNGNGTAAAANDPPLSKGATWLIQQIDSMQKSYREALMSAVAILEYRKSAKTLRLRGTRLPRQLNQKLERAWAAYEATRRHVEWYMTQNALHASTPSHPAIIMPTSQAPVAPPSVPDHLKSEAAQNKASPIDLSSASMLAYDHSNVQANNANGQQAGNFGDGTLGFGTDGNMNMSMDIGELSAIINGSDNLFGSSNQGDAQQNAQLDMFTNASGDGAQGPSAATPGTQAETDKLLESLGGMPQSQSNNSAGRAGGSTDAGAAGVGSSTNDRDVDVDALLASLDSSAQGGTAGNMTGQNFTFDFGSGDGTTEVDLSELAGLFSDAEVASGTAALASGNGSGAPATMNTGEQTAQKPDNQQRQQEQTRQPLAQDPMPTSALEAGNTAPTTQAQPTAESTVKAQQDTSSHTTTQPDALDFQNMTDDFQMDTNNPDLGAIDLDDFNFGDNDMPNVEGDEFESLFAEFK